MVELKQRIKYPFRRSILVATKIALVALFTTIIFVSPFQVTINAASQCPSGMTDLECLKYLQDLAAKISNERGGVQSKINSENKNQKTLNGKITSLRLNINSTELSIQNNENQIALLETQIRLLGEDLIKTQQEIDTLNSNITMNESLVQRQALQSYITRFRSPLEAILDAHDFSSMIRGLKYLQTLRDQFKILLQELQGTRKDLETIREKLKSQKLDIESKVALIEIEKQNLEKNKSSLDSQRAEMQYLLKISEQTEAQLAAQDKQLKAIEDAYTSEVTQLIFKLYDQGQIKVSQPVKKGDILGRQGHTGCSFGSHLHFEVRSGSSGINPISNGYYTNSGNYLVAGSLGLPEPKPVITQYYKSGHRALDMISTTGGNQIKNDKYFIPVGGLLCAPTYTAWRSLRGEGAPIFAVADGYVSAVRIDKYGGKYVFVVYNNGLKTLFLHLM